TVLVLDADYISRDMLPALAAQHFRDAGADVQYRLAVVPASGADRPIYHSGTALVLGAPADARVDLFQVRVQDFSAVASEINRFATIRNAAGHFDTRARTFSIVVQSARQAPASLDKVVMGTAAANIGESVRIADGAQAAGWKLLVQHPSGSLEHAVNAA